MHRTGLLAAVAAATITVGCIETSQEAKDTQAVQRQQSQLAKIQPIPTFDWSLERDLMIQLYELRNAKVATHAVWRGLTSIIEGDCPSLGFGLPYDVSLTNPLQLSTVYVGTGAGYDTDVVEQAEPNGIFASKNTNATWVMCIGQTGQIDPVYVEAAVTVYGYPLAVDYNSNRVERAGASTASINR